MTPLAKRTFLRPTHHAHWDHVWGNHCFKDSILIAHELCRQLIETLWTEKIEKHKLYIDGEVELFLPNLTFANELYFADDKIRIFYTPGHTMDSISVFDEEEKILNVGDNIGDTIAELVPNLESDFA